MRIVNAPLHPFDYAATVEEIRATVAQYQQAAGGEMDLGPIVDDLSRPGGDPRMAHARAKVGDENGAGRATTAPTLSGSGSHGFSCRSTTPEASVSIMIQRSNSVRSHDSKPPRPCRR